MIEEEVNGGPESGWLIYDKCRSRIRQPLEAGKFWFFHLLLARAFSPRRASAGWRPGLRPGLRWCAPSARGGMGTGKCM